MKEVQVGRNQKTQELEKLRNVDGWSGGGGGGRSSSPREISNDGEWNSNRQQQRGEEQQVRCEGDQRRRSNQTVGMGERERDEAEIKSCARQLTAARPACLLACVRPFGCWVGWDGMNCRLSFERGPVSGGVEVG